MKISICVFLRRNLIHLLILLMLTLSASYLIMVNTSKKGIQLYGSSVYFSALNFHTKVYKVRKRASVITPRSRHPLFEKIKVILIWSPLFAEWAQLGFLTLGTNSFRDASCSETKCEITANRNRLFESDAILFHIRTMSMFDVPQNRTERQKWIFFSLEAPPYSRFQGFDFMYEMFNWTMSYRADSDIVVPYGRILPQSIRWNSTNLYEMWKRKTKMAVWMVSHCFTDGKREKYVNQLKNFVEVDIYGSCGFASCPFNKTDLCVEKFSKQYYFFLAFENAICKDYVTEKLFRTLQYDMIPVVFGGGNYTSIAPSHSFIDALRFSSPKQLSDRMFQIASNFTEFSSYFKWRSKGYAVDTPSHCELCAKLHSEDFQKESVYRDINHWWVKNSKCKAWKSV